MSGTSPGPIPGPGYRDRDRDRDQNSKLYDIFNWVAFQVNFFVHHILIYYFHTNVGFFLKMLATILLITPDRL
jgi:hypothetical protein